MEKTAATLAREAAGLTIEQAAKRAGFTVRTIQRYERGDGPSLGLATKLARLYGCNPFLFTRQGAAIRGRVPPPAE